MYEKWRGRIEINSSIFDQSIGYKIISDKHRQYLDHNLINQRLTDGRERVAINHNRKDQHMAIQRKKNHEQEQG